MPSVAMAFVNQTPDPFAGRQLDEPLLGKLDHAANGLAAALPVKAAGIGQASQSGGKHLIDRLEMAASQLLVDDSLLLGFEFDRHTSNLTASGAGRKLGLSAVGRVCRLVAACTHVPTGAVLPKCQTDRAVSHPERSR